MHQKILDQKPVKININQTVWDKKIIEMMNKLGYSLKDINEGLQSKDKHIIETYS